MGVRNPNSTSYVHPDEPNLLNLHKAMEYDVDGIPHVRVTLGSDNITVSGNVNVLDAVRVNNTEAQMIPVYLVGNVLTVNQGTTPWVTTGNANIIGNISGITSLPAISGNVDITRMPYVLGNMSLSGNLAGVTQLPAVTGNVRVYGNVNVDNFPSNVSITTLPALGNVSITQLPALGNVSITALPFINANIHNFPSNVSITQMPSITGNVGVSGNVSITQLPAITGNVTIADGGNSITVDGNVTATITGTSTFTLGTGSTDAFGRLRTSQPFTLFDSRARYYDHNEFSNVNATGGTVVYDANSSTYQLNVTAANGSSVIRETKRVFPYQPGKSLLVLTTFCMNTPKTNLRQRVGYFTTNNGIYFENDGTYNYLVIRSYSSGALVEDRIRQDAWDNPFLALQVDRTQIFWTDIEWLGVGSVRCGFVINGAYVLCHTFHHANIAGNTTTYMTTATLPVRYEITNTAGTTGVSMMRQICSTVISEGGYNAFTYSETAGRGTSVLRLVNAGTYYPIVSIRLDSTRLDAIVLPRQVDVLSPTVNYYRWKLVLNPTLTGATFAGHSATGTVEYDTAATAMTGGTELQAGYVSSRELSELGADAFAFQLGRTLAGVSDIVTLALAATSNNADVLAQIGWQEIT